jgi:uncharacterized protein
MPESRVRALRAFLEDPRRPPDILIYHELQGFLFAVVSAPELVTPSEWMPLVFGEQEPGYASLEEAQAVIGDLMGLYNSVNAAVFEDRVALPSDCQFRRQTLANLEDDAPIAQWSRGFLQGHQWLEESWEAYVPDALDDQFAAMLMTLTFFASKDLAEAFCAETRLDLAEMATKLRGAFGGTLADYAHLGRSIQQVISEVEADKRTSERKRVGRNEPCPCAQVQEMLRRRVTRLHRSIGLGRSHSNAALFDRYDSACTQLRTVLRERFNSGCSLAFGGEAN